MNATRIFMDLETYHSRNPRVIAAIRQEQLNRQPAQNKSKEEKALWHTEEGREARVRDAVAKTSVDPLFAEILCIAVARDAEDPEVFTCMEDAEEGGLRSFFEWVDQYVGPDTTWVGHNIQNFDLAIILNRARALKIQPPQWFPSYRGRYWDGRVYDTMLRTPNSNGLGMVSLEDACMAYGILTSKRRYCLEDGTPLDGSTVGLAFDRGEYNSILAYACDDITATRSLYIEQTFGCTRDCWEAEDCGLDQVYQLRDSDLPFSQKAPLILEALITLGRIPRDILPKEAAA